MSAPASCACDVFVHPRPIANPPGLEAIDYRIGDFASFRRALLRSRPGEVELVNWRPTAKTDLALQLVEWWAVLADILALYNERIASQAYLRTADLPESLDRLIRTLGYRPRPGIGARGVVAALVSGTRPPSVPAGFQIQSKPGPGRAPQIFEVDHGAAIGLPDAVAADPPGEDALVPAGGAQPGALLAGTITSVKPGDELLVLARSGPSDGFALTTVKEVRQVKDPRGRPQTLVVFADGLPSLTQPRATDFRVLAGPATARPWQYPTDPGVVVVPTQLDLDAVTRTIAVGSPLVLEVPGASSPPPELVSVASVTELIWYANGPVSNPATQPTGADVVPIPIPHTRVTFAALAGASAWDSNRGLAVVRHTWRDLGRPLARPAAVLAGLTEVTLSAAGGAPAFPPTAGPRILLEDSEGAGANGSVEKGGGPTQLTIKDLTGGDGGAPTLTAPLRVLFDVLEVSRGASVAGEVLGAGNAAIPGQEFTLRKSPLTYLESGPGYVSTLRVWVDGVEWSERPSFYGQRPDARIFVTREDEQGLTHVQFGDGAEGARLPSGAGNVVAAYRFGSGRDAPDAGTLSVIVKPLPGLRSIRNPVAVGGGADPDPPEQIRRYAPASVLTFGRAISVDDYETVAAQAPGVARARAYWSWDSGSQRAVPTVYVGDDGNAVTAANAALTGAEDPNRPVLVKPAAAVELSLGLVIEPDPAYQWSDVEAGVRAALGDAGRGLLGARTVRIGESLFRSRVSAVCLAVPGAIAVHSLTILSNRSTAGWQCEYGARIAPGEGAYFRYADGSPLVLQGAGHGP